MKTRQDAWTEENDLLLAETVLRHIREGSTQLNAFEEVGDKLNRTSAACGFRWNAVVRDQYLKAIELAKKQRKQRQRALNQKTQLLYTPPEPSINFEQQDVEFSSHYMIEKDTVNKPQAEDMNLTMDQIISFLENINQSGFDSEELHHDNDRIKQEKLEMQKENEKLQKEIERTQKEYDMIQQDYQSLVKIMDRARKMVLFDDDDTATTSFKMDRNGNLERIAK